MRRIEASEEPLAFELYAKQSLGKSLPLFGRTLFASSPSTFAPVADIPVPTDYVIGPGDELIVRGWGQVEIEARVVVDRSGQVFLPKIGVVSVAGVRYSDLHDHLQAAIQRIFRNFELNVSLGQLRSIQVFVVGQARAPGSYTVSSLSTMVNAIFAAGGPSARGSMRRIELRRGSQKIATLDLYEFLLRGDKTQDAGLSSGDVIFIPAVGPLAAISGSVNVPAIYELLPGNTLAQGIELAGGVATTADNRRITIERIEGHRTRKVVEVSSDLSGSLGDGDIVRVYEVSPAIHEAVTLRGNVASPGRYRWQGGMRVHDLIPTREFLLTPEFWHNKNGLVEADAKSDTPPRSSTINPAAPDINWGYAAIERTNPIDLTPEILPFNLAKAIDGDEESDFALQAGDIVTIFSEHDLAVPNVKRTKMVRLEGEFLAPGVYRCEPGETLRHLVARVGLTSESYLYAAEFTRESTRLQQQQGWDRMISEMEKSLMQVPREHISNPGNVEATEARQNLLQPEPDPPSA